MSIIWGLERFTEATILLSKFFKMAPCSSAVPELKVNPADFEVGKTDQIISEKQWPLLLRAFKVGRVVKNRTFINKSLTVTWFVSNPTLKACNSPNMQYYLNGFLFCIPLKLYFHFWSKRQGKKAIERETAFFSSPWESKGGTLDHFFYASHICHNFPYKLIPISMS